MEGDGRRGAALVLSWPPGVPTVGGVGGQQGASAPAFCSPLLADAGRAGHAAVGLGGGPRMRHLCVNSDGMGGRGGHGLPSGRSRYQRGDHALAFPIGRPGGAGMWGKEQDSPRDVHRHGPWVGGKEGSFIIRTAIARNIKRKIDNRQTKKQERDGTSAAGPPPSHSPSLPPPLRISLPIAPDRPPLRGAPSWPRLLRRPSAAHWGGGRRQTE